MHNELPQTVFEAIQEGWQYLSVRCAYCHRRARIALVTLKERDRLASVISRIRCRECKNLRPQVNVTIGQEFVTAHERPIYVEGNRVYKLGMT